MSRENQIEEMSRIICSDSANKGLCEKCGFNKGCWKFKDAESIYNAGYRKQSEVAREIFDEIERTFKGLLNGDISNVLKLLSTLKKEYTEQKLDEAEKALEERKEK